MYGVQKKALIITALVVAVVSAPFVNAQSEPLDDERIERIRQNCIVAQGSMQRILRSDVATRINRANAYESLLAQMAALNSRAALNQYSVPELAEQTRDIADTFILFKEEYQSYEIRLQAAIDLNCEEQPVTFYDAVVVAREARDKLSDRINIIEKDLDEYQLAIDELATLVKARDEEDA